MKRFPSKVAQRIKEAMEPSKDNTSVVLDFVYPVLTKPSNVARARVH